MIDGNLSNNAGSERLQAYTGSAWEDWERANGQEAKDGKQEMGHFTAALYRIFTARTQYSSVVALVKRVMPCSTVSERE